MSALTTAERDFVAALRDAAESNRVEPRPGFAASLRERLVVEATAIEAAEADAFEAALNGAPAANGVGELATFATALAGASNVRAPSSLRFQLRNELARQAEPEINVTPIATARARRGGFATRLSRRFALAAALSAMMVSTSAMAFAAAANDTPADSLYGLKRFRERAQTWFISGLDEGVRRLSFAQTRVEETETMLDRGIEEPEPYEVAFAGLEVELRLASELIIGSHQAGNPAAVDAVPLLADFLTNNHPKLDAIAQEVPEAARTAAVDAIGIFESTAERAEAVIGGCVLCPANPLVPGEREPSQSCDACGEGSGEPGDDGDRPRLLPRGGSKGSDGSDPGDDDSDPGDDDDSPVPNPIPTPLPDPDRIPDVPGRLDDELEAPVGDLVGSIIGLL